LEGNGALITNLSVAAIPNLDASKVTTGEFDTGRIPNLNADKITTGTISGSVLPASATRGEISVSNLTSTSSTEQGFITGRRFRAALTFDNIANKPTTFPPSAHTHDASEIVDGTFVDARLPANIVRDTRRLLSGAGITISGNGDLSADRTISVTNGSIGITQLSSDQRMTTNNVLAATAGASAGAVGTYAWAAPLNATFGFGALFAGSSLVLGAFAHESFRDAVAAANGYGHGQTLQGTWRSMGRATIAGATRYSATLWLRIS
jgi:hypothetical protein